MIVVKLRGGLGNQLFQYAIGKRLSLYYKTALKLDTTFFDLQLFENKTGSTPRCYELDQLNIHSGIATQADIEQFSNSGNLLHRIKKYSTQSKYIAEKSFRFDSGFLNFGKSCYLDGFWQCENYFKEIADALRNDLTFRGALDERNVVMESKIKTTNAVSIHVRRGDYIHNDAAKKFHGICSLEYYKKAVELISKKIPDPHFFIFSDDLKWVADNFCFDFPSTIVDINDSNRGAKDIQLIRSCKHHIIANSSFSWWGAWLGNFNGKIVIAPKVWFADLSVDVSTVLPEKWYKL